MMIATTINIDKALMDRLDRAVEITGAARVHIISCLMRFTGNGVLTRVRPWESVRYQERRDKARWKKLHVSLRGDEYEYFTDLRKVLKLSVSHIIAIALEQYLDEIVKILTDGTDNYHYHNYIFSAIKVDDIMCWVYYWGIPQKLLQPPA